MQRFWDNWWSKSVGGCCSAMSVCPFQEKTERWEQNGLKELSSKSRVCQRWRQVNAPSFVLGPEELHSRSRSFLEINRLSQSLQLSFESYQPLKLILDSYVPRCLAKANLDLHWRKILSPNVIFANNYFHKEINNKKITENPHLFATSEIPLFSNLGVKEKNSNGNLKVCKLFFKWHIKTYEKQLEANL